MHTEKQIVVPKSEPVTADEGAILVSRRDILKVAWTAPVVMAVSPPLRVLAGSGTGPEEPPPGPPPWDKSSIEVTARCSGSTAIFTIKNVGDGDMTGPSEWRAYKNNQQVASGNFQLESGESLEVPISSAGVKVRLIADQRPGHPGNSEPQDDITCGSAE